MGFQEKPLSISLELTVPQTDTGGRAEYAQALERTQEKELNTSVAEFRIRTSFSVAIRWRSFQMMVRAGNLRVMQALADAANRLSEGEVARSYFSL